MCGPKVIHSLQYIKVCVWVYSSFFTSIQHSLKHQILWNASEGCSTLEVAKLLRRDDQTIKCLVDRVVCVNKWIALPWLHQVVWIWMFHSAGFFAWACLLLCKDWYSWLMLLLPATSVSDVCLDFIHYSCMFHYKIFCPGILFKHSTDQNKHCGNVNRVQTFKKHFWGYSKKQTPDASQNVVGRRYHLKKQSYCCWMASSAPGWLAVLAIPLGLAADHNQYTCC